MVPHHFPGGLRDCAFIPSSSFFYSYFYLHFFSFFFMSTLLPYAHTHATHTQPAAFGSFARLQQGREQKIHISGDARTRRQRGNARPASSKPQQEDAKRRDLISTRPPEVRHDTQEDIAGGSRSQRRIKRDWR